MMKKKIPVTKRLLKVASGTGWIAASAGLGAITVVGTVFGMPKEEAKEGLEATAATFIMGAATIGEAIRGKTDS